jgi:hypothetical protein
MSPEVPVGDLADKEWRHVTVAFVRARHSDLGNDNIGDIDTLELNAVAGAAIETGYADAAEEPDNERYFITRSQGLANAFLGNMMLRSEANPTLQDDDQLYKAACFRIAVRGFALPRTAEELYPFRGRMRGETTKRLVQVHTHLQDKLVEYGDDQHGPEMARLFTLRAELLMSALLMRKVDDYEPTEETAIVVPALTRQANSLVNAKQVDHKWSSSLWRLNTDAALRSGLCLATPPDAKLRVKHQGSRRGAARYDSSITYISLLDDVIQPPDEELAEEHIGSIASTLNREANRSRGELHPERRDELDFVTRNARDAVDW